MSISDTISLTPTGKVLEYMQRISSVYKESLNHHQFCGG